MRFTIDMLKIFYEITEHGSFSETARKLGKSQSAVSTAIANLEIDTGLILFDRSKRYPVLTAEGKYLISYAKDILEAAENMEKAVIRLTETESEKRLTLVLSDMYHISPGYQAMHKFADKFPFVELELLDSEGQDIISLVQSGRAQIGLIATQDKYPPDIIATRLPDYVEMGVFAGRNHPLAKKNKVSMSVLLKERQICLNTFKENDEKPQGKVWLASDYMMILEMVEEGFGWAELPYSLLEYYQSERIVKLDIPEKKYFISADIIRSRQYPPGKAGNWFAEQLLSK